MRAHTLLRRQLETEVLVPRGLTFNDFEALVRLSRADESRMRRIDLADSLLLARRVSPGCWTAFRPPGSWRTSTARTTRGSPGPGSTDEGKETSPAWGVNHADLLRAHFRDALDDDEVIQLTELLGRLPGVEEGFCAADE